MDRLAEQVVVWHNRHPLAKRITIYDVHTIGVVALPFMRSGPATPAGKVEPVLNDELSAEDLAIAAAFGAQATHEGTRHQPPAAELGHQARPATAFIWRDWKSWRRWAALAVRPARYWAALRASFGQRSSIQPRSWPAFSESFITGLSPKRIAAFARDCGYTQLPGGPDWPQRIVPFDDGLMAGHSAAAGAWPFELYLLSAGIDAGSSRSRILLGQGRPNPVIGRRCLSPQRLSLAGLLALGLIAVAVGLLWPRLKDTQTDAVSAVSVAASAASSAAAVPAAEAAAPTASAALAATQLANAASANRAVNAEPSASRASPSLASVLASAASAPKKTADTPAKPEPAPAAVAASEPVPDIRPQFVKPIPKRPVRSLHTPEPETPLTASKTAPAEAKPDAKSGSKTSPSPTPQAAPKMAKTPADKTAERASKDEAADPISKARVPGQIAGPSSQTVVALVGPTTRSRGEAETMLLRMRTLIEPTQANPAALQAQVFQTPDGWRPAVWPFASREEAQLINATLIARGLRVKAVDF
jgi:hypothetical protein